MRMHGKIKTTISGPSRVLKGADEGKFYLPSGIKKLKTPSGLVGFF